MRSLAALPLPTPLIFFRYPTRVPMSLLALSPVRFEDRMAAEAEHKAAQLQQPQENGALSLVDELKKFDEWSSATVFDAEGAMIGSPPSSCAWGSARACARACACSCASEPAPFQATWLPQRARIST